MSTIIPNDKMISSKNFLSPLRFQFNIAKTPNLNYFVQRVRIPGITLGPTNVPTPFKKIPLQGDQLVFSGDIEVIFKISEDLSNWMEIFNWMVGLGFPNSGEEFRKLLEKDKPFAIGQGLYSSASLVVLSSANNPIIEFDISGLVPVGLSGLDFNTIDSTVEHMEGTATFAFQFYYPKYLQQ